MSRGDRDVPAGSCSSPQTIRPDRDPLTAFRAPLSHQCGRPPRGLDADRFDDYAQQLREQASALATDAGPSAIEETELDGEPARTWSYESRRREQPRVRQQQVVVIHADALYTVTWSARRAIFEESQAELQRLLDSWRWSRR